MIRINLLNETDRDRLEEVKEEMKQFGSPTLRAWKFDTDEYFLIEGSHRASAALELGLPINLVIIDFEEIVDEMVDDITDTDNLGMSVRECWHNLNDFPAIEFEEENVIITEG